MGQLVNNNTDNTANFRVDEKGNVWVNSLYVSEITGKEHKNVLRDIENIIQSDEDFRQLNFEPSEVSRLCGVFYKNQPMFWLSEDGSSVLLGGYSIQHRIKVQKELRQYKEQQRQLPSYQIEDPIDRANMWIKEQKEKQLVLQQNILLEQKITEQAPMMEEHKAFINTDELYTIAEAAKLISNECRTKIGQNKMFELLRKYGALCKSYEKWNEPMQSMIEREYMTLKTKSREVDGEQVSYIQTYITAKGVAYIRSRFVEFGDIKTKGADTRRV